MHAMQVVNLVGQNVGNYVVLKQLGAGGMGTVYLAEHPVLKRKVAIKVLHDEHTMDADLVARFFQEARAAAAIGEQHIINVIDAGELHIGEHKVCYLMMELLDGKSLGKRIEQGPIPPDETAHIIHQVCMALAASHDQGIIHRDLKPENIYLCPRSNDPEFVKVLDFGIAKLTGPAKGSGRATRIGTVLGTPAYMSPEQCVGIADVDPRADIYALGIVMYEMLTGQPPFDGDIGQLIEAQLRQVPLPPSARNPAVPPAWDAIVMHCLEKARDDRFRTMDEVDAAIADPAGHLLVYQQQAAARDARAGGHRTAVLPRELRPDHIAAARAAGDVMAAGPAAAVTTVTAPEVMPIVPLAPQMPTLSQLPTLPQTPTPMPGPLPMGTPAPFMAAAVVPASAYASPTTMRSPRSRRSWWIGSGAAVAIAGAVFVAGLIAHESRTRAPSTSEVVTSPSPTTEHSTAPLAQNSATAPLAQGSAAAPPAQGSAAAPPAQGSAAAPPAQGSAAAPLAQGSAVAPSVEAAPIQLAIVTEPAGAKVSLKRRAETWTGTSPYVLELTPTDEALTIVVALPGFRPVTRKVTPRSDAEVLIVLTRLPVEPRKQRHPTSGDDLIKP